MFFNDRHREVFMGMIDEAYLDWDETLVSYDEVLRRQLGFLYILAYYQEDYVMYEGEGFYVEMFEDLEIGGPTYLFEDAVVLRRDYPHEYLLKWAKALLIGEVLLINDLSKVQQQLYKGAREIANL